MTKISLAVGALFGLCLACKVMPKLGLVVGPAVLLWSLWMSGNL